VCTYYTDKADSWTSLREPGIMSGQIFQRISHGRRKCLGSNRHLHLYISPTQVLLSQLIGTEDPYGDFEVVEQYMQT
jgi:hypothetical protein